MKTLVNLIVSLLLPEKIEVEGWTNKKLVKPQDSAPQVNYSDFFERTKAILGDWSRHVEHLNQTDFKRHIFSAEPLVEKNFAVQTEDVSEKIGLPFDILKDFPEELQSLNNFEQVKHLVQHAINQAVLQLFFIVYSKDSPFQKDGLSEADEKFIKFEVNNNTVTAVELRSTITQRDMNDPENGKESIIEKTLRLEFSEGSSARASPLDDVQNWCSIHCPHLPGLFTLDGLNIRYAQTALNPEGGYSLPIPKGLEGVVYGSLEQPIQSFIQHHPKTIVAISALLFGGAIAASIAFPPLALPTLIVGAKVVAGFLGLSLSYAAAIATVATVGVVVAGSLAALTACGLRHWSRPKRFDQSPQKQPGSPLDPSGGKNESSSHAAVIKRLVKSSAEVLEETASNSEGSSREHSQNNSSPVEIGRTAPVHEVATGSTSLTRPYS